MGMVLTSEDERSRLFGDAARLLRGRKFDELIKICESQQQIRTSRLLGLLEKIYDCDVMQAKQLKKLAERQFPCANGSSG